MSTKTILFVAEPQAVSGIFPTLKEAGLQAGLADNLNGALQFVRKSAPAAVFCRPRLQGFTAEKLLAEAQADPGFPPVVIFSRGGTADEAQRYMELGAHDFWLEPLVYEKIQAVLPRSNTPRDVAPRGAVDEPEPAARPASAPNGGGKSFQIIGKHPAVLRVLALARQVARSKATVLISGDSGTGKEMFARFLHHHSDRADRPFVAVNCAALPEHLLESELFGHEKGAFTGAINRKLGKFELASGGTILLDEVTEMDLGLQAKLLRVLQEGEIDRVGGVETVGVDVRVLATTNRDIEQTVQEGKFRQDLFYRLNVIPLRLPALRDRGEDALLLADFFVAKYCAAYSMPRPPFADEARQWLLEYDWPGNVRELQNLMERAVLLAGSGPVTPAHFLMDPDAWQPESLEAAAAETDVAPPETGDEALSVMPLHEMEKRLVLKSLNETGGNRTQAAELLGISVRTLRNKINEYKQLGLTVP
jgi:DNA-binding NtrC family response regulator